MKRRTTLRRRVAATMALLATTVLAVAGAAVYLGARHALTRDLDQALAAMASAEIASSMDAPGGAIHVHEQPADLALAVGSGYEKFAEIVDAEGRVRARTLNLARRPALVPDAARVSRALAGTASFGDARRDGERYRTLYQPLRSAADERLVAVIAVPRRPLDATLDQLLAAILLAIAAGGGAAALAASRLAGRLVRPIEQIAEAARSVVGREAGERIPEVSADAEVHALVTILNEMLTRLEASLDAQRRLVADASHELRTPLSNLRGTIEVALLRPRDAPEYRATLETSLAEVVRLSRLVAQLLTLSRADAGRLVLCAEPCDLAAIARDAAAAALLRAATREVEIRVEAPDALPLIGDGDRLREVVDNLVDNAIRFAPARTTVTVDAARAEGGLRLAVCDEGPGVRASDRVRIFERFYRADPSRHRGGGGAGLGLAIAKAIVDAHGGHVTVEPRDPTGASFHVWLPPRPPAGALLEAGADGLAAPVAAAPSSATLAPRP